MTTKNLTKARKTSLIKTTMEANRELIVHTSGDRKSVVLTIPMQPEDEIKGEKVYIKESETHKYTGVKYESPGFRDPYTYEYYPVGKKWDEFESHINRLDKAIKDFSAAGIKVLNKSDLTKAKSCLTRHKTKLKKEAQKIEDEKTKEKEVRSNLKKEIEEILNGLDYILATHDEIAETSDSMIILGAKSLIQDYEKIKNL